MIKRRVAELSAQLTADTKPYETDMRRAARVTRQTEKEIESSFSGLERLGRGFAGANLAKGLLAGLGIGSGVVVVSKTVDMVIDAWKASDEYAKSIEERAVNIAKQMQATSKAMREAFIGDLSPERQLEYRKRELEILQKQADEQQAAREKAIRGIAMVNKLGENNLLGLSNAGVSVMSFGGEKFGGAAGMGGRTFHEEMLKRADEAQAKWNELRGAISKAQDQVRDAEKAIASAAEAEAKKRAQDIERIEKERTQKLQDYTRTQVESYAAMEQTHLRMLNSMNAGEYDKRRDAIEDMFLAGKIGAEGAADALEKLETEWQRMFMTWKNAFDKQDKFWAEFYEEGRKEAEKTSDVARELGLTVSSAFEDAIVEGEKLSEVLRSLWKDLVRLLVRKTITEPLIGGITKIFGFADGGRPPMGRPSMVGERGPELFVPDTAGTIIPNEALSGMGGFTYAPVYNIAAGVTRQELKPLLDQRDRAVAARLQEAQRRGAPLATFFA